MQGKSAESIAPVSARTVTRFITKRLKLKGNESKSAVDRPWKRKLLGDTFTAKGSWRKVSAQAIECFQSKVRTITRRTGGKSVEQVVVKLQQLIRGWRAYFGLAEVSRDFKLLDSWIRRKLRCLVWKRWGAARYRELKRRGVRTYTAWVTTKSGRGPWRLSNSPAVLQALPAKLLSSLGLPTLSKVHL